MNTLISIYLLNLQLNRLEVNFNIFLFISVLQVVICYFIANLFILNQNPSGSFPASLIYEEMNFPDM